MASRIDKLRSRILAAPALKERADEIIEIATGKTPLRHGVSVEVTQREAGKMAPNGRDFHTKIKASTDGIARDSGIIPVEAWENGGLANFERNPIILAFHSHRDPIGVSVYTDIEDESMNQYWQFHMESETSRMMKTLYEKGYMRAASVGFLVHDFAFLDELDDKEIENLEKKYGRKGLQDAYWIARQAELLETSAVCVPSDPKALAFDFAAKNARAVGIDVTPLLNQYRGVTVPTPNTETEEQKSARLAAEEAERAKGKKNDDDEDDKPKKKDFEDLVARVSALEAENEKLKGRCAALETRSTDESQSSDSQRQSEEGEERYLEIEVNDDETEEQARERFIDAQLARAQGAPQPKK